MSITKSYQHSVRVYAEDVDFMGIVYHANYLCYLERARTEILRSYDLLLSDLIKMDIGFAISELVIKYVLPAKLDDFLTISTEIKELKSCSFVFEQIMKNQHNQLICNARVKAVCVNSTLKPIKLPNIIKELSGAIITSQ